MFNIYMVGYDRDIKDRMRDMGVKLRLDSVQHSLAAGLFADDTVLFIECKEMLCYRG